MGERNDRDFPELKWRAYFLARALRNGIEKSWGVDLSLGCSEPDHDRAPSAL
jgi:hypothetical protein